MAWRWAPLLAAGAEFAALYPALRLLGLLARRTPPPGWLVAAVLFGGMAGALLAYARLPRLGATRLSLALAGALLAGLLPLVTPPYDALAALLFGALWWRGVAAAQYGQTAGLAPQAVLGLAAFSALPLLLQTVTAVPGWSEAAGPDYLLLFVCSLGLLAAARAESLRRRQATASGHWSASGPLATVAAASLLLLPALLVWVASDISLRALLAALALAGRMLETALLWSAVAVVWVLQWPLQGLIALLRRLRAAPPPPPPPSAGDIFQTLQVQARAVPLSLQRALGFLGLALLLALVAALIYRAISRIWRQSGDDGVPEERESTFAWERLWRRPAPAPPPAAEELGTGEVARVRLLYRRLQRAGADAGRPRRPAETPGEYLAALPLPPAVPQQITALYEATRYAGETPDPSTVAAAEAAASTLER